MVVTFKERTAEMLRYLDTELSRSPYFAGDTFTAADLMMNFPFGVLTRFLQFDLSPYPNIVRHLDLIGQRPAYKKAMALAESPG